MKTHIARLVFLVLVLSASMVTSASEEVRIVFPRSVVGILQHGNLMVVVNYEKANTNRVLELIWDSEGESGGSTVEINTENNGIPVVKDLDMSPGEYVFVATLYRNDGTRIVAIETRFVTR